jgi:UrcA family protein
LPKSKPIYEEFPMYANPIVTFARSLMGFAAVACTLSAGNVVARDRVVAVELHVRADGLDLRQPADVSIFYERIQHAAQVVCTHGNRVGLVPLDDPKACSESALGAAIASIKVPLLTRIYLATHTLRQAAAFGIDVPVQLVAK